MPTTILPIDWRKFDKADTITKNAFKLHCNCYGDGGFSHPAGADDRDDSVGKNETGNFVDGFISADKFRPERQGAGSLGQRLGWHPWRLGLFVPSNRCAETIAPARNVEMHFVSPFPSALRNAVI